MTTETSQDERTTQQEGAISIQDESNIQKEDTNTTTGGMILQDTTTDGTILQDTITDGMILQDNNIPIVQATEEDASTPPDDGNRTSQDNPSQDNVNTNTGANSPKKKRGRPPKNITKATCTDNTIDPNFPIYTHSGRVVVKPVVFVSDTGKSASPRKEKQNKLITNEDAQQASTTSPEKVSPVKRTKKNTKETTANVKPSSTSCDTAPESELENQEQPSLPPSYKSESTSELDKSENEEDESEESSASQEKQEKLHLFDNSSSDNISEDYEEENSILNDPPASNKINENITDDDDDEEDIVSFDPGAFSKIDTIEQKMITTSDTVVFSFHFLPLTFMIHSTDRYLVCKSKISYLESINVVDTFQFYFSFGKYQ
jgi:hypothetical protein